MSCKNALIDNVVTIPPDATVKDALQLIEISGIRSIPVVDNDSNYVGMFGLHCLMDDLLPMAARMEDGIEDLGFVTGGAPSAAKKIRKLSPQPIRSVMQEDREENAVLSPDVPMLEVIRRLSKYGSPLPVVDNNKKFVGLVSEQSSLIHLRKVLEAVEKEEQNEKQ